MLPVICLPGLMSTGAVYRPVDALSGAQVLALPALDVFGAIGAALAEELPPRCILVGHSMGAYLCLDLWRRAPGRIAGIALLSCTAAADTPEGRVARGKAVRYAEKAGIAALAQAMVAQALGPAAHTDEALRAQLVAQIVDMAEATGVEAFAHHQTALAGRPDSTADLPGITCPVLAVTGSADPITPPAAGRALAKAAPRGAFHEIEGAGHMLPLEAPDALSALLRPFLTECAQEATA